MDVNKLLDKCAESCSARNDAALCVVLGVKKQTLSNWRHGHNLPDAVSCDRIAQIAGLPLAKVLGVVGEARAISREEKSVWRKLSAAAVYLIAAGTMLPLLRIMYIM